MTQEQFVKADALTTSITKTEHALDAIVCGFIGSVAENDVGRVILELTKENEVIRLYIINVLQSKLTKLNKEFEKL